MLSKDEIKELVEKVKLIEYFEEKNLQPAGYDLRLKTFYEISGLPVLEKNRRKLPRVSEIRSELLTLDPGDYVLIETIEKINMPNNLAALVLPRSTLFRMGLQLLTAVVDPGFKGSLTMGLRNVSQNRIKIRKGVRVAQIVFFKLNKETEEYSGIYQGGKVVV